MCVSKNLQIRGICISGALFLFYAPKFLKCPKIILSFLRYLCFNAKIPHRSAGFLPASFLSMQLGAGGGTRTPMPSLAADFESATSTNSITPAGTKDIIHNILLLGKHNFQAETKVCVKGTNARICPLLFRRLAQFLA